MQLPKTTRVVLLALILPTVTGTSACTPRSEPAADETDSVAPEDRNVLPHTKPPFQGKIAPTAAEERLRKELSKALMSIH